MQRFLNLFKSFDSPILWLLHYLSRTSEYNCNCPHISILSWTIRFFGVLENDPTNRKIIKKFKLPFQIIRIWFSRTASRFHYRNTYQLDVPLWKVNSTPESITLLFTAVTSVHTHTLPFPKNLEWERQKRRKIFTKKVTRVVLSSCGDNFYERLVLDHKTI